jgi:intracellular multiplication protein IcmC
MANFFFNQHKLTLRQFMASQTGLLIFLFVISLASPALADAGLGGGTVTTTFGSMLCNARNNFTPLIPLFNAIAYIVAAFMAGQMGFTLVKHYSGDQNSPMVKAVALGVVAGSLAALPSLVGTIQTTLLGTVTGGGASACVAGTVASAGSSVPLDQMMNNFVKNIYAPAFNLLGALAFVIGVFFIVKGMMRGAKVGTDPRAASPAIIITYLVIGGILVSAAPMLTTMLSSLFGVGTVDSVSSADILAWAKTATGADMTAANNAMRAVLAWVQIIGAIAFIRGFMVMKSAVEGSGQATIAQGLTHIIGGVLAINIFSSLQMFDKTFGTGLF